MTLKIRIPRKIILTKETLACVGLFFFLIKRAIMTALLYLLHTPTQFNTWVAIILMYIPIFLIPFVKGEKRKAGSFVILWICVFAFCMLTYLFHPEYEDWLFRGEFKVWTYIFMPDKAIYLFLFIRLVNDPKKIQETLKWAGFVLIAYNVYKFIYAEFVRGYWVTSGITRGGEGEYNLGFGYDVLLLFVLFTIYGKERNKWYYTLSAVSLACILLAGSRGPLVGVALTIIVLLWDKIKSRPSAERAIIILGLGVISAVVIINMSSIMLEIGLFLQRMGFSSRTVSLLASGNYSDDSGRSVLWGIARELIQTGGPFGNGLYGDRYVIAARTQMWIGYTHNVVLEILVDFGYLLGSIIICTLVYRIFKIIRAPQSDWRTLYLIFLIASSQLLLSGSFWYIDDFWGALALDICWFEANRRYVKTSSKNMLYESSFSNLKIRKQTGGRG